MKTCKQERKKLCAHDTAQIFFSLANQYNVKSGEFT